MKKNEEIKTSGSETGLLVAVVVLAVFLFLIVMIFVPVALGIF